MALDVLVTGGAGSLGREIVACLRSKNYSVISCGHFPESGADAHWDISKEEMPTPDCRPAVVVHAAARIGQYQQPLADTASLFDVNVTGTLRVVSWCISHNVEMLVLISGAIVYGEWDESPKIESDPVKPWVAGPYAVSKWCSEQVAHLIQQSECKLAILRLSSLYGPGYKRGLIQRIIQEGKDTGRILLKPPFHDAFDLMHITNAAHTVKQTVEKKESGLWNVGSGKITTIQELVEICARNTGAQVIKTDGTSVRPARIINWVDDQKARALLGHENRITIEDGILEILQTM